MENKKETGKVIVIVILLIIVLGLGGYLVYDKLINTDKVVEQDNEKSDSIKKDESKELVYDADYKTSTLKAHYLTDSSSFRQYLSDIKVPYINIESEEVDQINNEIKKMYLDLENEYVNNSKEGYGYVEATYDYVVVNDVLSIVFKYRKGGTDYTPYNYYTYNIDLKDLNVLNYTDLLDKLSNKYNLTQKTDFINKVIDDYYNGELYNIFSENVEPTKEQSLAEIKKILKSQIDNKEEKCFFDRNENINCAITISIPVGSGKDNKILFIDKKSIFE